MPTYANVDWCINVDKHNNAKHKIVLDFKSDDGIQPFSLGGIGNTRAIEITMPVVGQLSEDVEIEINDTSLRNNQYQVRTTPDTFSCRLPYSEVSPHRVNSPGNTIKIVYTINQTGFVSAGAGEHRLAIIYRYNVRGIKNLRHINLSVHLLKCNYFRVLAGQLYKIKIKEIHQGYKYSLVSHIPQIDNDKPVFTFSFTKNIPEGHFGFIYSPVRFLDVYSFVIGSAATLFLVLMLRKLLFTS